MMPWTKTTRTLAGVLCLTFCGPLTADQPEKPKAPADKKAAVGSFVRLQRDLDGQPVALETAVVRCQGPKDGVTVDLVGAVHVGDRAYYAELNRVLKTYDVVLYELVAPAGTRPPKGGRPKDDLFGLVRQVVKLVLDLDWQVDRIDYTRDNFVHADLSPDQMAEAVRERGDDGLTLFLSVTADLLRQENLRQRKMPKEAPAARAADLDLGSLLLDPEAPVKLKRLLAEQLVELDAPGGGLGPTLGTILIADRNEAAMKVFQKELAKGRKKIAIFYGAAHLPEFEKRLRTDFGLERRAERWLTAWDIRVKEKGLDDLMDLLKLLAP
jgi:hypothetical protein